MVPSDTTYYSSAIVSIALVPYISRKSGFFHTPPVHSTIPLGGSPLEYCDTVWYRKTRVEWLSIGEKV